MQKYWQDLTPLEQDQAILIIEGRHHDPHTFLGCHAMPVANTGMAQKTKKVNNKASSDMGWRYRAWLPAAESAQLVMTQANVPLTRVEGTDLFIANLSTAQRDTLPLHPTIAGHDSAGAPFEQVSPYSFLPQIGDLDLHLFAEGRHWQVYDVLGAHPKVVDDIAGVHFAVWAPAAERVSVVGSFNQWHGLRHPMRTNGQSGVWELFIPGITVGELYKFEIRSHSGQQILTKIDPFARAMEYRPDTGCLVDQSEYSWQDNTWTQSRKTYNWQASPINIYEVHLGSWQKDDQGTFLNYRELAHRLVEYVKWMGFTHIELLPVSEHPLDLSWGYQATGYFAPTSRFGSPDDFRYFIDHCHQNSIGVFLDWVPAHFPKDAFALAQFDGNALFEHADPRQGEHQDWGTLIFNYGRNEVKNFLISNALFWIKEFHIDGLRVDAVASMLYLDYSRDDWVPNQHGGRENLEALEFIRTLNEEVHGQCPGAVVMAEESTSWPMVSRPTWMGGLGFSMKWNMGWMNDTLSYFEKEAVYRSYHHSELTFSQMYAYSENFILPLSHDEVVHLKGSLIEKMPGDDWQKAANVRLLLAYQSFHPGKKLVFMGDEFAQWSEWSEARPLDWYLCDAPLNRGVQLLMRELNHLYQQQPALHERDFDANGFAWIDCHDYQQSILSFMRKSEHETIICIFNFTPVPRENYRIGLPETGLYNELLNSDSEQFGGSNVGNGGQIEATDQAWMNLPASAELSVPPLGVIVLKKHTP